MRFEDVDIALLDRCRDGDQGALEELCGLIQRDLYAFIFSMLRNHEDTDEALQESLLRMFRHLPHLKELSRFPWWLMRIAVNQCNDLRSRSKTRALVPLDDELEIKNEQVVGSATPPVSPRDAVSRSEMMIRIRAAMDLLPPRQRAAIVLFEIENRSVREIAQILDCSEGAIKFNLHEARHKLRDLLREYLPQCSRGEV